MSFDWKSIVKTVAPVLGTAIGGPFGGMASKAITSALLGPDEKATGPALEAKLSAAIQDDPDALLKLKKADQEFDTRMKELDVDILKIDAQDRDSARTMAKETGLLPQMVLAAIYVAAFTAVLLMVFMGKVALTGAAANMANILIGILSAGLMQIMNFFYGSSSGSKEKTAAMTRGKFAIESR